MTSTNAKNVSVIDVIQTDQETGANMITDFQIELMLATGLIVWGYIVFVKLS